MRAETGWQRARHTLPPRPCRCWCTYIMCVRVFFSPIPLILRGRGRRWCSAREKSISRRFYTTICHFMRFQLFPLPTNSGLYPNPADRVRRRYFFKKTATAVSLTIQHDVLGLFIRTKMRGVVRFVFRTRLDALKHDFLWL